MKRNWALFIAAAVGTGILGTGCYTILAHPEVDQEKRYSTRDYYENCSSCHQNYHGTYDYGYYPDFYYDNWRWNRYYLDPWWYNWYGYDYNAPPGQTLPAEPGQKGERRRDLRGRSPGRQRIESGQSSESQRGESGKEEKVKEEKTKKDEKKKEEEKPEKGERRRVP